VPTGFNREANPALKGALTEPGRQEAYLFALMAVVIGLCRRQIQVEGGKRGGPALCAATYVLRCLARETGLDRLDGRD
jgi:hypothetical protein